MVNMNDMMEILEVLKNIYSASIEPDSRHNERYLHHYLSNKLQNIGSQQKYFICYDDIKNSSLHPEWPTKKAVKNVETSECGKYRYDNEEKKYKVDDVNGTAGFIDFTIGKYEHPEIGIELKASSGWRGKAITYDMMKLMDSRNPFKKVISYNIIFRKDELPQETTGDFKSFENAIAKSLSDYQGELNVGEKKYYAKDREYLFWIIEIGKNRKRSWYCSNYNILSLPSPDEFIIGDPI
jgi:hypothetical protein